MLAIQALRILPVGDPHTSATRNMHQHLEVDGPRVTNCLHCAWDCPGVSTESPGQIRTVGPQIHQSAELQRLKAGILIVTKHSANSTQQDKLKKGTLHCEKWLRMGRRLGKGPAT